MKINKYNWFQQVPWVFWWILKSVGSLGKLSNPQLVSEVLRWLSSLCSFAFFFCLLSFLGPHPQHVEVPRLGVKLELQLLAYARATSMPDPSHILDLQHSSRQCQILNILSEARDQTHNLMVPNWICFCCTTMGTLLSLLFFLVMPVAKAVTMPYP